MLVEVNGLDIMLVIESMVEFMMSLKSFTVVLLMIMVNTFIVVHEVGVLDELAFGMLRVLMRCPVLVSLVMHRY